jgi:hypothetical protein
MIDAATDLGKVPTDTAFIEEATHHLKAGHADAARLALGNVFNIETTGYPELFAELYPGVQPPSPYPPGQGNVQAKKAVAVDAWAPHYR